MSRQFYIIIFIALSYAVWTNWLKPSPHLNMGGTPSAISSSASSVSYSPSVGVQVNELEKYSGEFRVLRRENYSHGTEAQFSPVDFAVGWGDMAKPEIYSKIDISQSNRWYRWRTDSEPPISYRAIETQSANMHIIPANEQVAKTLKKVKADDMVYLQGALVEIQMDDGWQWRSSLSREDTGAGACELMRVDQVRIL